MPIALEITLIVVLVAITAVLVPLLIRLRGLAKGIDAFLASAKKDLSAMAEDMHASRLRMDHLTATLQTSADNAAVVFRLMADIGQTVKNFNSRFHNAIESSSRGLGGIIGGIHAVLALFKRRQCPTEPQKE